jgi:hypothetical protein
MKKRKKGGALMGTVKRMYFRPICLALILGLLIIGGIPRDAMAYVIESKAYSAAPDGRARDSSAIQRVLDERAVSERLSSLGLSKEEVSERVSRLTDDDLREFASQINGLYPGSGPLGVITALLIIAILFMVLLKMTGRKIILK